MIGLNLIVLVPSLQSGCYHLRIGRTVMLSNAISIRCSEHGIVLRINLYALNLKRPRKSLSSCRVHRRSLHAVREEFSASRALSDQFCRKFEPSSFGIRGRRSSTERSLTTESGYDVVNDLVSQPILSVTTVRWAFCQNRMYKCR